jgi:hypothetical protein
VLGCRAGRSDGVDGRLDASRPLLDVEVVGLVHQAEDDLGVGLVFNGELAPDRGKLKREVVSAR